MLWWSDFLSLLWTLHVSLQLLLLFSRIGVEVRGPAEGYWTLGKYEFTLQQVCLPLSPPPTWDILKSASIVSSLAQSWSPFTSSVPSRCYNRTNFLIQLNRGQNALKYFERLICPLGVSFNFRLCWIKLSSCWDVTAAEWILKFLIKSLQSALPIVTTRSHTLLNRMGWQRAPNPPKVFVRRTIGASTEFDEIMGTSIATERQPVCCWK